MKQHSETEDMALIFSGIFKMPTMAGERSVPWYEDKKSQEFFLTHGFIPSKAYQITSRQFVLISSELPFCVQHLLLEFAAVEFLVPYIFCTLSAI